MRQVWNKYIRCFADFKGREERLCFDIYRISTGNQQSQRGRRNYHDLNVTFKFAEIVGSAFRLHLRCSKIKDNSNEHIRSFAPREYFLIHIWVYFCISKHSFLRQGIPSFKHQSARDITYVTTQLATHHAWIASPPAYKPVDFTFVRDY
jgi:hypothetical protein